MIYSAYTKSRLKPTSPDIEGPFYKSDAPFTENLTKDPNLHLFGTVRDTEGTLLPNVILDFWQADAVGVYDNNGFFLRGKVKTNAEGVYHLHTIHPGDYQIDVKEFRCAHIHVKLTHETCKPLTTQLYFKDDKYNVTDHWFNSSRIIDDSGAFNFVLEKL